MPYNFDSCPPKLFCTFEISHFHVIRTLPNCSSLALGSLILCTSCSKDEAVELEEEQEEDVDSAGDTAEDDDDVTVEVESVCTEIGIEVFEAVESGSLNTSRSGGEDLASWVES